jgi:NitT/TauT family transport system permease protein
VALAPLFVIWMGTASQPKIAIAVMIAIFPIVIDSVLGLRSVDPEQINLARSCALPRSRRSGRSACPTRCRRSSRA